MRNQFFLFFALIVCLCIAPSSFSQQSSWKSGKNGWVMKKSPNESKYQKFFPIGLWNMPGYTSVAMENDPVTYRKNAKQYLDNTTLYNTVYMSPGKDIDAHKRVEITGSIAFYEAMKDWQAKVPGIEDTPDAAYAKRHYIKNHVNDKDFVDMLDNTIRQNIEANGPTDHIWAPLDEIVNGASGGWCWHPEVGEKIYERIKKQQKNTLVFTDLVGIARGNPYLFEKNYLKTHKSMPATPPYEALGEDAKTMKDRPLLGFFKAYDGKPVYINGTAYYTEFDLETLKTLFYENMKICSKDYRGCGDIFGLNAFIDFNTYPILAGVTVDGIKAGVGAETPVWLFFDGNGYAKPSNMSVVDFVQLLKCQIYTSVIHGATGVLFWNDRSNSPEIFEALNPVVEELTRNLDIIYMDTHETKFDGDLHYMIKKTGNKKCIMASNTSKTETLAINISGISKKSLAPLEVFISSY